MELRKAVQLVEAATQIEKIKCDPLPYSLNALEPALSAENVRIHYEILTKKYFDKYNQTGDLFQKAGAVLHNSYYWPCMKPYEQDNTLPEEMVRLINQAHGSFDKFKKTWLEAALGIQGNGWVLLLSDMQITTIQNHVLKPGIILAYDQWEHSLTDYQFNREAALEQWWQVVNWNHVLELLAE